MGIRRILGWFKRKVRHEVKVPVYIPVHSGNYLNGKNVMITGGGSGIGYAIAAACLRNGASVIITGRNAEKLEQASRNLADLKMPSATVLTLVMDVTDIDSHLEKILEAAAMMPRGTLDILVNNAGVSTGGNIGFTDSTSYDCVLNTNLKGTYFISQAFSNYLLQEKKCGNILIVSSSSGIRPAISPYMVSKWGEVGLTQGLAKKLAPYGITVNGIAPGPTATGMLRQEDGSLNLPTSPVGRYASPEEIANLAVFLISDMGRMIVGETVYITGGCATLTKDDIGY